MSSRGTPERTIALRCYAHQRGDGRFYAECIDLDIAVVRDSMKEAIDALNDAVVGHVLAAAEHGWLDDLVPRPSPFINRLKYHCRALVFFFQSFSNPGAASFYPQNVSRKSDRQPAFV